MKPSAPTPTPDTPSVSATVAGRLNDLADAVRGLADADDVATLRGRVDGVEAQVGELARLWAGAIALPTNEIWVRPNTDTSRNCAQDILQAFDDAAAKRAAADPRDDHPLRPIRFRAGSYPFDHTEPIPIPVGTGMIGSGHDAALTQTGNSQYAAFIAGTGDPACANADRPDLFGIADTSFCPTPGARRGIAGGNGRCAYFEYSDLNLGFNGGMHTYWETQSFLSLDLGFKVTGPLTGGPYPGFPLVGVGSTFDNDPRPWVAFHSTTVENAFTVMYSTSVKSTLEYERFDGLVTFLYPTKVAAGSVVRMSVQLDVAGKACEAWVNGTLCARAVAVYGAGSTFRDNVDFPLFLGNEEAGSYVTPNVTFFGLRVGDKPRYVPGAKTLTRVGGGTINDAFRFLEPDGRHDRSGLIGYLTFDDPVSSRYLTAYDGRGLKHKGMIKATVGGGSAMRLKDFKLVSQCTGIVLGTVLDFRAEGLWVAAGCGPCVGSVMGTNVSYPVLISGCKLPSSHANVHARGWLANVDHCDFPRVGRYAVLARGSTVRMREPFVASIAPGGACVASFALLSGGYGEKFIVDGGYIDNEDGANHRNAAVEVWGRHGAETRTYVSVGGLAAALSSATDPPVGVRLHAVPDLGWSRYTVPETNLWYQPKTANVVADKGWEPA